MSLRIIAIYLQPRWLGRPQQETSWQYMFYSRKLNTETNQVEIWECEWSNPDDGAAEKRYIRKAGNEGELEPEIDDYDNADAVCWAPGRTIGNIAVSSELVLGKFDGTQGTDAILPCQIIPAGKFRHGAPRWYCKTHQVHWGTKADFAAAAKFEDVSCSNHTMSMSYVVNPLEIEFRDFEEIGIWCSLPPAISSEQVVPRSPKIHVHKRFADDKKKLIDRDFDAVICSYNQNLGLFDNTEITKIQVTPPAAFEFVRSIQEGRDMDCVSCKKCGYPHLDLGDFAINPHRKHFCGNCGNDSIWSKEEICSTPLKPLHDQFSNSNTYMKPDRVLNMAEYEGLKFEMWASTPAVVWTADRPLETGIHVHVYDNGRRVVDDTFGQVIHEGNVLCRNELWERMVENTIY